MGVITGDRLDEQKNSLDNYSKPETRWEVLPAPLATTTEKVVGAVMAVAGVVVEIATIALGKGTFRLPSNWTQHTKYFIYLGTGIAGLCYGASVMMWLFFRNLEGQLLQERSQVGKEIETASLADLRAKYRRQAAFSDQELNEWIRHLAAKVSYDQFIQKHSERIFGLNLDTQTKNLLKQKYQEYLRRPDNAVSFKDLKGHKAFQVLLPDQEKQLLLQFVAARETDRLLTVNATTYAEFISKQGVDILGYVDPHRLERLAPGFVESVYQSKIGILQVQKNHALEIQRFDASATTPLLQSITEREAQNSYEVFKVRNGTSAIEFITSQELKQQLRDKFIHYAVGQNLGIVQARKNFAEEIQRFGGDTNQKLTEAVFNNEAEQLSKRSLTYKQYRKRNGIETIEKTSSANPQWIHFHRQHFLLLPYNDLVNLEFQRDRNLFQITWQDIQTTLWNRWNSISLKDVLTTEGSGFAASMQGQAPFFNPREWTAKAVMEMQKLSVYEVIKTYPELFRAGVLTAADGNLWHRLLVEISSIHSWTDFMDKYGTFVFEYRLLDYTGAARLVHRFIDTYAESFLNENFSKEFASRYVEPLTKHSLLHPSLSAKLTLLRERKSFIEKTFKEWKTHEDQQYANQTQQTQSEAEQKIHQLERHADLPRKQREKTEAEADWKAKKSAHESLQQAFELDATAIQQLSEQIRDIQEKKLPPLTLVRDTLLAQNPQIHYPTALAAANAASAELKKVEDFIAKDEELKDRNASIEKWSKQYQELQQKQANIESMKKEKEDLEKKVNDPQFAEKKKDLEIRASSSHSEITPPSVKKAQEDLQEMKNEEAHLADLKKILVAEENQLRPIEKDLSRIETLLKPLYYLRDERLKTLSTELQLDTKRTDAQQTAQKAEQWKSAFDKFNTSYNEIERLQGQSKKMTDERSRKEAANEHRKVQLPLLLQARENALSRKTRAESSYSFASEALARQTTEIRSESRRKIEEIQQRHREAIAEKEAQKTRDLKELITELKWHLETLNSRRA